MKKILSNKKNKITLIFSLVGIILIASLILSVFAGTKKSSAKNNEELTPTPTIITFTIDEDEFSADYEMTWVDWVESEYNTINLVCNADNIVCSQYGILKRNDNNVLSSYYVIENAEYEISISLISFTIDNVSYNAVDNMTWAEWVASEYNTGNFYVNENQYVYHGNNLKVLSNNVNILKTAQITSNGNYTIEKEILQFTIDDNGVTNTYSFENGMTWAEWVASQYNTCDAIISNDDSNVYIETQDGYSPLIYTYQLKPNMPATRNYCVANELIVSRAYSVYYAENNGYGGGN